MRVTKIEEIKSSGWLKADKAEMQRLSENMQFSYFCFPGSAEALVR